MPELRSDRTERTLTHIEDQLDQALADLKIIKGAFPEDEFGNVDTLGHRRYHEEMISAAKAQTKFWEELRRDLIKKGLMWGLLAAIGLMATGLAVKTGITWNAGK
jgi:hypothetical protein